MNLTKLQTLSRSELSSLLSGSPPVSFEDLAGQMFRGTTLAMPGWFGRVAWTTFQKVFSGTARAGHNVRLEQNGMHAPAVRKKRLFNLSAEFGTFGVESAGDGVWLNYGIAENRWSPMRFMRDPLVNVGENLILGVSDIYIFGKYVARTPTYFSLVAESHSDS